MQYLFILLLVFSFRFAHASPPKTTIAYRELVITELLADESPRVGLPAAEFVELYNATDHALNLKGCVLSDPSAKAVLPDFLLPSHGYVIVCKSTYQSDFQAFGVVIGLSTFPSLNNVGDDIRLYDATGKLIDRVQYTQSWYHDPEKANGGWSLEQIDLTHTCGEETNWTASASSTGGTPGQANSVAASKPDLTPPRILRTNLTDALHLLITFNEKLDTVSASDVRTYGLNPGIAITAADPQPPTYRDVLLTLAAPLQPKIRYTLSVQHVADCNLNRIEPAQTATLALAEPAVSGDVVINEVLFNPRPGGVDFVELYNRSQKFISLKNWHVANLSDGTPANPKRLTDSDYLLAPDSYLVITTSSPILSAHYPRSKPETFLVLTSLPSYPDDAGTVVLRDAAQQEIDQLSYTEDWHSPLLQNPEGVSLERLHPAVATSSAANWHSAATTEGYATPGYRNSQTAAEMSVSQAFQIEPRIITPNDDGYHDFATLHYYIDTPGTVGTVTIFDMAGREICQLAHNQTLATEGFFTWEGLNARDEKVRTGRYIVVLQTFTTTGESQVFKEDVVVSW